MTIQKIAFFCACFILCEARVVPPLLQVSADTYYEAGFTLGNAAKQYIRNRLQESDIQSQVRPFLATQTGKSLIDTLYAQTATLFPDLTSEMKGIANGSSNTLADIFMLTALSEIEAVLGSKHVYRCTDVLVNVDDSKSHGHNEDGAPGDVNTTYFANVSIVGEPSFVAYAYAGTSAGDAYGWNSHGVTITTNAIYAIETVYQGTVPRSICARDLYRATSVEDAVNRLRRCPSASAFNVNFGTTKKQSSSFISIEIDPMGTLGVHTLKSFDSSLPPTPSVGSYPPHYYTHTNVYRLLMTKCVENLSSLHRDKVLQSYPAPNASIDIRTMLGDTSDPMYPIYRTASGVDTALTLSTVVYDYVKSAVMIFVGNPRDLVNVVYTWTL
eukprot:PhF_6_TR44503/c0_g1_i1/m.68545